MPCVDPSDRAAAHGRTVGQRFRHDLGIDPQPQARRSADPHALALDRPLHARSPARADNYAAAIQIGEVMTGESVGQVLVSGDPNFKAGDFVVGSRGWQTHWVSPAAELTKISRGAAPLSAYLGMLGMPARRPMPASPRSASQSRAGPSWSPRLWAVGSVAGQLAKRAGARVVGIAGGPDKCLWVQDSLGFDDCVDHRSLDLMPRTADRLPERHRLLLRKRRRRSAGGGVRTAQPFARVAMCGMVSQYNEPMFPPGPNLGFVVGKRILIQGFIVSDRPEA